MTKKTFKCKVDAGDKLHVADSLLAHTSFKIYIGKDVSFVSLSKKQTKRLHKLLGERLNGL